MAALLAAKSPTQSEHQIIGSFEIHETIADMEHSTFGDMNLQGKHFIHTSEIVAIAKQIGSCTEVDAEIRHGKFTTSRKTQTSLSTKLVIHILVPRIILPASRTIVHAIKRRS